MDGIDEVRRLVAAQHPPEIGGDGCGIDAETITRLAREFAGARSAVAYGRLGVCHHATGSVTHWLINVLNVVTGNLDRPGGRCSPHRRSTSAGCCGRSGGPSSYDTYRSRGAGLPALVGELSVAAMADEITRSGCRPGARPDRRGRQPGGLRAGLRVRSAAPWSDLDLLVCIDFYLSETARRADFVLPPVSHLERSELDLVFPSFSVRNNVRYSPRASSTRPQGAQEDWDILQALTAELPRGALGTPGARAVGSYAGARRPDHRGPDPHRATWAG